MINKVRFHKIYTEYSEGLISEIEMAIQIRQMADKVIDRIELTSKNALQAIKDSKKG